MKITNTNNILKNCLGNGEEINFSVKASSTAYQILSDGLYKNKIGSMIRELLSNAVDSQRENGNEDTPIHIQLPSKIDQQFIIRDFGTGLSEQQMKEIYTSYFSSTKADDNTYKGGFGLGSKTPLCYNKEQFIVNSYYNHEKISYLVYVDESGIPTLKFLLKESTEQPSGLEVCIGVFESDIKSFYYELCEFLKWNKIKVDIVADNCIMEQYNFDRRIPDESIRIFPKENVYFFNNSKWLRTDTINVLIDGIYYTTSINNDLFVDYENSFIKLLPQIKEFAKRYGKEDVPDDFLLKVFPDTWYISTYMTTELMNIYFDIPIGTIDLTASRENISITEKTRNYLLSMVFGFYAACYWKFYNLYNTDITLDIAKEIKENSIPYSFCTYSYIDELFRRKKVELPIKQLLASGLSRSNFYYKGKFYHDFAKDNDICYLDFDRILDNLKKHNRKITGTLVRVVNKVAVKPYIHFDMPRNIILCLGSYETDPFIKTLNDDEYAFIRCPSKKCLNEVKELFENNNFFKFNLFVSNVTTKVIKYTKKKCKYYAFENYKAEPIGKNYDAINVWQQQGKTVYGMPIQSYDLKSYEVSRFLKILYHFIPEDSLVVFVQEYGWTRFCEHYKVNNILDNKEFMRFARHVMQNDISFGSSSSREFFLKGEISHYNSIKYLKVNNCESYKRWLKYIIDYSKKIYSIFGDETLQGILNWYMPTHYCRFQVRNRKEYSYLFKALKGNKLRNFINDLLTNDIYMSYSDRKEFMNVIDKLFEGNKNV